jgi:hypothetical protein
VQRGGEHQTSHRNLGLKGPISNHITKTMFLQPKSSPPPSQKEMNKKKNQKKKKREREKGERGTADLLRNLGSQGPISNYTTKTMFSSTQSSASTRD